MPRFFIDIRAGDTIARDDDGADYPQFGDARQEALSTLADVSRVHLGDGSEHGYVAAVRDEDDKVVFKATLSLTVDEV
ncbi:DUF6894 family protein [Methylobacterium gnaphalii]|uniref:DUF6894 domain-containing protein n=1 Tax=Methylobacterium gnaphalii TaxID=1010610 RepID=A0A512JEA5_9HYPH|nr:hypothetical protein [Methylobacterium gnaphalii]GEP08271.1 hypothetical protein MGN01_01160 [Methylobacterium gnaphalii]GJD67953.1 hypothetical protein MMMDOFMJ_0871 [Methylobacterium gnaphalii]GLS51098.1 hypothetical protein GCM10007885_39520 [Methylobacterium gnaphalii]